MGLGHWKEGNNRLSDSSEAGRLQWEKIAEDHERGARTAVGRPNTEIINFSRLSLRELE